MAASSSGTTTTATTMDNGIRSNYRGKQARWPEVLEDMARIMKVEHGGAAVRHDLVDRCRSLSEVALQKVIQHSVYRHFITRVRYANRDIITQSDFN